MKYIKMFNEIISWSSVGFSAIFKEQQDLQVNAFPSAFLKR